jgi:hypothetical protein
MRAVPVNIDWHPGLSIYASEKFLKSVGDEYGWLGGLDKTGKIRCILPYTIVRKAKLKMVRFRVETIPIGEGLDVTEEKAFLNGVVEYFRTRGADIIIPATTNTIFRTYPDGAIAAPYGTLIIDLDRDEEALFGNFSSSHRRKVRLAEKAGLQVHRGLQHGKTAYELVRETFRRSSIPFMRYASFRRMVDALGENVEILLVRDQEAVQGCLVVPFSEYAAYYVYGGSVLEPAPGAMNLVHWEAIRMFRKIGVQRYDFCGVRINPEKGSKQEGLMTFKERFGPRLAQGYIWKYTLKTAKSAVYSAAVRILRGGDIVDAERHKIVGL